MMEVEIMVWGGSAAGPGQLTESIMRFQGVLEEHMRPSVIN